MNRDIHSLIRLLRALSTLTLNVCKGGASTSSLLIKPKPKDAFLPPHIWSGRVSCYVWLRIIQRLHSLGLQDLLITSTITDIITLSWLGKKKEIIIVAYNYLVEVHISAWTFKGYITKQRSAFSVIVLRPDRLTSDGEIYGGCSSCIFHYFVMTLFA